MEEAEQPRAFEKPKQKRKLRVFDVVIIAAFIVVVVILVIFILGRLRLTHEVTDAKVLSDKVVSAMAKQNTAAIRSLGDKQFQEKNTAASLNSHLTATDQDGTRITFAQLYGDTAPTVDKRIVANNSRGQHVAVIYRYDKLKAPFFVRIDTAKTPGSDKWTLQGFSASPNEANLLGP